MEYIELRDGICDDCVQAIANDDYTSVDDETEAKIVAGLERIGKWLVVGEEQGFRHTRCEVCRAFPGNRHSVGYLE